MPGNPVTGAGALLRGFGLILRPGLRRYVIVPLAINMALFGAGIWYAFSWLEALSAWVQGYLPGWLDWLTWLLWPLFIISALLLVFYGFSLLANLVAAPFNGLLAERVELLLTGRTAADGGGWRKALAEFLPMLANELRKLLYMAAWSLPFLLLFVIPVINLAAPFLWLAFSAWMLALEYTDYPMGNHGIGFRDLRRRLRRQRLLSLGFGGAVLAGTVIPLVNLVVMPAAVAGATALWVEKYSKENA